MLRLARDGDRHAVREPTLTVLLEGDFSAAWAAGDSRQVVATDSIKVIWVPVDRFGRPGRNGSPLSKERGPAPELKHFSR